MTVFGFPAVANFLGTDLNDTDLANVATRTPGLYEVVNTHVQRVNGWGEAEHPAAMPLGDNEWDTCWVSSRDGNSFYTIQPLTPTA